MLAYKMVLPAFNAELYAKVVILFAQSKLECAVFVELGLFLSFACAGNVLSLSCLRISCSVLIDAIALG